MEAFGEKLRRQREKRGITLEAISNTTKISTRMLRALEEEHFDQLPGGVFNKGFIRAYARQVGLDEEEAITDYLAALHESQLHSQKFLPDFRTGKPPSPRQEPVHHVSQEPARQQTAHEPETHEDAHEENAYGGAQPDAESGVIAADEHSIQKEWRQTDRRGHDRRNDDRRIEERRIEGRREEYSREPWQIKSRNAADLLSAAHSKQNDNTRQPRSEIFTTGTFGEADSEKLSNRVPWGTLAAALLVICAIVAFWNVRRHKHSAQAHTLEAPSMAIAPTQASTPPRNMESPVSTAWSTSNSLKRKLAGSTAVKPNPAPRSKPLLQSTAVTNHAAFTLLIRAEKTSWVSITADGKLVAEETLIAPAEKSVRASNQVVVKAGNSAGISFLLNAKEIPAEGKDGEVKTYVFDASGMKVSASLQPSTAD